MTTLDVQCFVFGLAKFSRRSEDCRQEYRDKCEILTLARLNLPQLHPVGEVKDQRNDLEVETWQLDFVLE